MRKPARQFRIFTLRRYMAGAKETAEKIFLKVRGEIRIFTPAGYIAPRKAGSFSETEVLRMQKAMGVSTMPRGQDGPGEDVVDTLIAISVVSKRLAEKLRKKSEKEETHEQDE